MGDIIRVKINVDKIDKAKLFKGEKGRYLDVTLLPNRDGEDQYGNSHMAIQDVSKEEREAGVRGAILGNAKTIVRKDAQSAPRTPPPQADAGDKGLDMDSDPFA